MNAKILIVLEPGAMRSALVRALASVGFEDVVAANGSEEALRLLHESPFSLVLINGSLPQRSGGDLAREIRASESSVPIVLIVTEGEKGLVRDVRPVGIADYLTRPFTPQQVRATLEKHIIAV